MTPEERLLATGFFEVDADGAIWRRRWAHGTCPRRRAENKIGTGYLMVRQMLDGRRLHLLAHRIVWTHFNGPIPTGLVINHINGRKSENAPGNLEAVTPSENVSHAHRMRLRDQRGEGNPSAKLSNRDVAALRAMYAAGGHRQQDLAERFGVAFQTVSKIVRGERRDTQGGPMSAVDHRFCASAREMATGRFIRVRQFPEEER